MNTRKITYRLAQVTVLVETILGGTVIFEINAKLQVALHDLLVRLGPLLTTLSLGTNHIVQHGKGQLLLLVSIVSNCTIDEI